MYAEIVEGVMWVYPESEDDYIMCLGWLQTDLKVNILKYEDNKNDEK